MTKSFLDSLARPQPNPGGGSASAYTATVALALLEKIRKIERKRDRIAPEDIVFWEKHREDISTLSKELVELRDRDGLVYSKLAEARSAGASEEVINQAWHEAIECPLDIIRAVGEAMTCAHAVGLKCRRHLIPDALVVCELLAGAAWGATYITKFNIPKPGPFHDKYWIKLDYHSWKVADILCEAREAITARKSVK
ncbi:MAG: cyclodeaminase/cyclohydrolase family protein [Deltaproteobacteria bacterium]|nr:cyclodeaminase/cyclohydrolase family protein [Deltaproteobacteria bacterium]